ncbi:MAG: DUF6607 family protein [Verrucomicrobiota bacterium]
MKHLFFALTLTAVAAAAPPEQDRKAILAMAGNHAVDFHFQETVPVAPGYKLKEGSYDESAHEIVKVVEDSPERIALQHILVVKDKKGETKIIKHWAQVWTWQDTEILDYCGEDGVHNWKKVKLSQDEAAGTWSQLVTQVDDTPRYEGYGRWVHKMGESSWQSSPTRRPLPRREYTKRDDYDYLLVTNRHTITPIGWVHFQDNRKIVDREDEDKQVLCYEEGLNSYVRAEVPQGKAALDWWAEHGAFWDEVRTFWISAGESTEKSFSYTTSKDGESLSKLMKEMQDNPPEKGQVAERLQPFVIADK